MLKCGQKDNVHYTFGLRQEQIKEAENKVDKKCCPKCEKNIDCDCVYCPFCGEKI